MNRQQRAEATPLDSWPLADTTESPSRSLYAVEVSCRQSAFPSTGAFEVLRTTDGRGAGIRARRPFERGTLVARVSGHLIPERKLHTLQIRPDLHLYDPHFCGLFLHACDPNVFLDMQACEVWAMRDIAAGELVTMDYTQSEDVLHRQFHCLCGAPNCRGWITGRKERPNTEGKRVLSELRSSRSGRVHGVVGAVRAGVQPGRVGT